ncbi:MAG: hypothetical protein ACOYJL_02350 [Tractidigestivibacter sp.]|uniref:hypothetical protein n=1 Tax=Tractidigestivibacter sp. TaxID=2847320 RepID=UPI003D8CABB9
MVIHRSERLKDVTKALEYGVLVTLGLGVLIFIFAFLTSGFDAVQAGDWVRKILYILSALGILIGGGAMLFYGDEYAPRVRQAKAEGKDPLMKREGHLSWQVMLVIASAAALVITSVFELVYLAILGA